jgi:hypothetical protein
VVRVGTNTSTLLNLNTEAPPGCVLSPLLYSLFTHDANNDETAYREEVRALGVLCQDNNLSTNVNKTKELILETAEGAHPYPHRRVRSGEGGKLQVSRRTHHRQTEMVHPHRHWGDDGATAPIQAQEADEIWLVT